MSYAEVALTGFARAIMSYEIQKSHKCYNRSLTQKYNKISSIASNMPKNKIIYFIIKYFSNKITNFALRFLVPFL
jgi:hypothetical protein